MPATIADSTTPAVLRLSGIVRACLAAAFLWSSSGAAAEATGITKEPPPDWVIERAVPLLFDAEKTAGNGGTALLLVDEQRHVPDACAYGHYARAFTNQSGVQEGSRISIDFDPDFQSLALHQLRLHRNGEIIDQLDRSGIRLLARETSMDRHLYDGEMTAVIDVEDVRVGDTLEYAFSVRGRNPVFKDRFSDFRSTQSHTPLKHFCLRVLSSPDRDLRHQVHGPGLEYSRAPFENLIEHVWAGTGISGATDEQDSPAWFSPYGWVQIGDYSDWAEVVEWALDYYQLPDSLPSAVEAELDRLRKLEDPEQQILGALDFAQNQIRYLSVSTGVHSHKPYPISDVIARGFGDCKDKARLTSAMLRKLGFEAWPALVETDFAHTIADWLPSPQSFDHVVVALDWNAKRYWLDPTSDHQGGSLDGRYFPAFGKALLIRQGTDALEDVTPSGFDLVEVAETETYTIAAYDQDVKLVVDSEYRGREADWMRYTLASRTLEDLQKDYLNYAAQQHPGVMGDVPPRFLDDKRANIITSSETYQIRDLWRPGSEEDGHLYAEFFPYIINDLVAAPKSPIRHSPLAVLHPKRITESFVLHLPDDSVFDHETFELNDPAFSFASKVEQENRVLKIQYRYESRMDHVPAGRVRDYLENLRKIRAKLGYSVYIPDPAAPADFQPNWTLILLTLFLLAASVAGAVAYYRWRPAWPPRPAHPHCHGLGGWLILVALGLLFRPVALAASHWNNRSFWDVAAWDNLTRVGQSSYHPLWMPALLLEKSAEIPILVFSLLLIILFFQKRKTFPLLFNIMLITLVGFHVVDGFLIAPLAKAFPDAEFGNLVRPIVQSVVQAAIWIPYMLVSQRVKATFIK